MTHIVPCLWFNREAEEAANFYVTLLPNSYIQRVSKSPADYPGGKKGDVLTVEFTLDGNPYIGMNGGSDEPFTNAVSFQIMCEDQDEVDRLWAKIKERGKEVQCGWIKDSYGLSWQIVPKRLTELMQDEDLSRAKRAMEAMMQMVKIDVAELERAVGTVR